MPTRKAVLRALPALPIPPAASVDSRAGLNASFERITGGMPQGAGWAGFEFREFMLSSHFQPIFDVHGERCVAYEGLLTAKGGQGKSAHPQTVFSLAGQDGGELFMDWLCRGLHLRNFANVSGAGDYLFLNAYPSAAIEDPHHPHVFRQLLEHYGVSGSQVVIEILETGVSDEAKLVDAVDLYRGLGCKIAIDDFGIGFSNFERLWRLKPDFVKIDRSVNASAVRDAHARRVLVNTVNLIHECGAKVVIEGIETRDEALLALEAGADFVQGYYFARPGLAAVPAGLCDAMFRGLNAERSTRPPLRQNLHEGGDHDVFANALNLAVIDLKSGMSFNRATEKFRALPTALRIYLVTSEFGAPGDALHERMVIDLIDTHNYDSARWNAEDLVTPLSMMHGIMDASLAAPREVHIFTAVDPAHLRGRAVTLSCGFELEGRMVVLVGEIVDRRRSRRAPPAADRLSASGNYRITSRPLL